MAEVKWWLCPLCGVRPGSMRQTRAGAGDVTIVYGEHKAPNGSKCTGPAGGALVPAAEFDGPSGTQAAQPSFVFGQDEAAPEAES